MDNNNEQKKQEIKNLSDLMIDKAEAEDAPTEAKTSLKGSKNWPKKGGTINRPLAECYPEIADDDHEQLLADVRRHWLGRFFIIFGGSFLAALMILVPAFLPSLARGLNYNMTTELKTILALVFLSVAVLIVIGMLISLWVYNSSRMLVTDQNVIEVRQMSLFSRKISHLNMINVEDVTVIKKGILQTIFDYGTMTTETAGEEENFVFINTPTPDVYRRIVINAHEEALERLGSKGGAARVEIAARP